MAKKKPDDIDKLVEELTKNATAEELLKDSGLLRALKKRLVEAALDAEMTEHLGYEKHSPDGNGTGNSRNGKTSKRVIGADGEVEIDVPRDRNGDFEPQLIRKRQVRLEGFDEKVLSLYARGMTTREIQGHLEEVYDVEVSPALISKVTDAVLEDVKAWQNRPLDAVWPVVYLDAIHLKIRTDGRVQARAVYVALGINLTGNKELLGLWIGESEGAKFWLNVLTELNNRGVQDILIASVDGLTGFPEAIGSVFPKTEVQLCIVHMVRNSMRYVPWKFKRAVLKDLKKVYKAATVEEAEQALDDGRMPNLKAMMDEEGYRLSHVDCGLPSMTSSCQAGIMFGDNDDIPAYRWYDKAKKKLYVSASDAPELNARYAHGKGLMREGVSILNMMNGDAATSLFTMADMFHGSKQDRKDRAEDISLLILNPFFLTRAMGLFLADLVRELWEGWRQRVKNVQPRINRLAEYYPFVRAGVCGMMREISVNLATLNMMRGAPVIYMLYLGYDEVAHHSGPWTGDAFGDLQRLDDSLGQLRTAVMDDNPRPYEFIILSDHGQSFGATFKQRYGQSIKDFIVTLMPHGTTVAQAIGGDTGGSGLKNLAAGLSNVSQTDSVSAVDRAVAKQGHKLVARGAKAADREVDAEKASVTAYGSGNACQVYFDLHPRKIKLSELESAYPGMVKALVEHEGIGLVLGYDDDGSTIAMGKGGRRNLNTREVTGEDPVKPYALDQGVGQSTVEKRVWQLQRVMEFPSAGDLWLISTLYSDGTVAALEELIGNHGGLGGEQTDAFIFHPEDLTVPDTRNAVDVIPILDGRRGG